MSCAIPNMRAKSSFEVIVQECSNDSKEAVDKLLQRSEARLAEMGKKKLEKDINSTACEQTDYFNVTFNHNKEQIKSKLLEAHLVDKNEVTKYFDSIVRDYQKLQKFLSDSTMFLPTYDIKISQEKLNSLQDDIQKLQNILLPKKKFSFKNKKKLQNSSPVEMVKEKEKFNNTSKITNCDLKNLSHQHLEMFGEELNGRDISLHRLKGCKVYLYGAPSTVFISGLSDCQIFTGPVSTSVHIENCTNCIFYVACQQLRVHSTTACIFHLHITSKTIIEDSSLLQFAPYNWFYEGQNKDYIFANLNRSINNWDSIDDFNWLVSGVPSPNWSLLPEEKYLLKGLNE